MPRYSTAALRGPSAYARPPVQPSQTDAERWQAWCASIVDTIETIRAEESGARCQMCGCSAHPPAETRRCYRCGEVKALSVFPRSHRGSRKRHYDCQTCRNEAHTKRHQRDKVRAFKQAFSGVAG